MSPELQRSLPPYLQIARNIRERILRGELKDGDPVPSLSEIQREWEIARATAVKVLSALQAEGLIQSVSGRGSVVSVQRLGHTSRDRFTKARATGLMYPVGQSSQITAVGLVDADDLVAAALQLEAGSPVVRRHRVTSEGDRPIQCSTSWLDGRLAENAPALLLPDPIPHGTVRYVEETSGRRAAMGSERYTAGAASADNAAELQIAEGSPVLVGENLALDADGEVIEFGQSVAVPGKWQKYEFPLDS